jgi:hypothetical protein
MKNKRSEEQLPGLGVSQGSRREFLEKAGRFAAYTPPMMLGLLYPGAHAIASGGRKKPRSLRSPSAKRKPPRTGSWPVQPDKGRTVAKKRSEGYGRTTEGRRGGA